jgi:hypothetical protein
MSITGPANKARTTAALAALRREKNRLLLFMIGIPLIFNSVSRLRNLRWLTQGWGSRELCFMEAGPGDKEDKCQDQGADNIVWDGASLIGPHEYFM